MLMQDTHNALEKPGLVFSLSLIRYYIISKGCIMITDTAFSC